MPGLSSAVRRGTLGLLGTVAAAGVLFFSLILPPAPVRVDTSHWSDLAAREPAGAYHIHTTRSDGTGDKQAVAAAARRAGLRFVILTDHGNATRAPDPPEYVDGVLCLDNVEISTDNGHYVALDMPPSPYPLGGAGDTVVEDVHRLGGFGIAAHPDSAKPELRWTGGDERIDGIEWLNADSEWRKDSRTRLVRAGLAYFFRPGPALTSLFDRPSTLDRWDRLTATRPVVGLAAVDAHGGVHGRDEHDDDRQGTSDWPGVPSYFSSFASAIDRVVLPAPLIGDAAADARAIYRAIRAGRVFSVVNGVAAPGLLDFHAETASGTRVEMGGILPPSAQATLLARTALPPGGTIVLLHGGRETAASTSGELSERTDGAEGAYRIEIRVPGAPGHPPVPWLVGNPIYIGVTQPTAPPPSGAAVGTAPAFPWRIEKDPSSTATLQSSAHGAELEYTLGGGARHDQFVALATDLSGASLRAVRLGLSSARPMRVLVQVRTADGSRWGRSFYVDPRGVTIDAALESFRPVGRGSGAPLEPGAVRSLLVAIDLTNALPGSSGVLRVLGSELLK
ncbi:MAG: hypothetical protein ACRD1V_17965 [Vicinamibacterales bacterium]